MRWLLGFRAAWDSDWIRRPRPQSGNTHFCPPPERASRLRHAKMSWSVSPGSDSWCAVHPSTRTAFVSPLYRKIEFVDCKPRLATPSAPRASMARIISTISGDGLSFGFALRSFVSVNVMKVSPKHHFGEIPPARRKYPHQLRRLFGGTPRNTPRNGWLPRYRDGPLDGVNLDSQERNGDSSLNFAKPFRTVFWLPPRESNPDMPLQRRLSYH